MHIRMKRIGFVGMIDGKPFFEFVMDEYCHNESTTAVDVYKSKKEAKKRFEHILPVYIPTLPKD